MLYRLAADLVLIAHVGIVAFVLLGLVLTVVGGVAGWPWVRNRWFRLAHLATIGVVVAQSMAGVVCPLTTWESQLRHLGGQAGYGELTFVSYWLQSVLFFHGEPWMFILGYSLFGLCVLAALWFVPVRWRASPREASSETATAPTA